MMSTSSRPARSSSFKAKFRELVLYIHNSKVLGVESADERFHTSFQGNPGTGKPIVAKLYAEFLKSTGVLKSDVVEETSGAKLASGGPGAIIETPKDNDGGVLFVDEAYQLVCQQDWSGMQQVLDIIFGVMESNPRRVVIFAGYKEVFEPF